MVENSRRTIAVIGLFALLIVMAFGVTYAAFSAKVTGLENASVISLEGGEMWIDIDGGPDIIANNLIPDNDHPWVTKTITLTGKNNTGDLTMSYKINIVVDNNTFVTTPMVYTLEAINNSNNGLTIPSVENKTPLSETVNLGTGYFTTGDNLVHTYILKIYFPDTGVDQSVDMRALYAAHISVEDAGKARKFIAIQNIEDLLELSKSMNNDGNDFEEYDFMLMRDLDFQTANSYEDSTRTDYGDINGNGSVEALITELTTGQGFESIGVNAVFKGSFNGLGHTLSNLYINTDESSCVALFCSSEGSIFNNLTLTGNVTSNLSKSNSAGLIGEVRGDVLIENVIADVTVINDNSEWSEGGFVGSANGGKLTINNCKNNGNVGNGGSNGGFVGSINGGTVEINNSENNGNITGGSSSGFIGAGWNDDAYIVINNCKNNGNVSGNRAAGVVSTGSGIKGITINKFVNNGDITSSGDASGGVLGIFGCNVDMEDVTNNGDVSATAQSAGGIYGNSKGGIVTIKNAKNTGTITSTLHSAGILGWNTSASIAIIDDAYNTGAVTGHDYAGGIIGCSSNNTGKSIVLNSYNMGTQSAQTQCAGGIVGGGAQSDNVIIVLNSYNTGTISASTSSKYASGIVGRFQGINTAVINNVHNYGSITGSGGKYGITYFATSPSYTMTNSYYLSGPTGSNKSGTTAKTAALFAGDPLTNTSVTYLLNNSRGGINLSSIDPLLADYTLKTWKLDSVKGYPVFED